MKFSLGDRGSQFLVFALAILSITACQRSPSGDAIASNLVSADGFSQDKVIGDDGVQLYVIDRQSFDKKLQSKKIDAVTDQNASRILDELAARNGRPRSPQLSFVSPMSAADDDFGRGSTNSLLLGMPLGLIGQQSIFGGVITQVSDSKSVLLGRLKLTDVPPMHIKTAITQDENQRYHLLFLGCPEDCTESSSQVVMLAMPITGVDSKNGFVLVDLAPIGSELNLVAMKDPEGKYTKLVSKRSLTKSFDYSFSTLVFDIESQMVPKGTGTQDPDAKVTTLTTRWYLKLNSAFNPGFVSRPPVNGVGFFTTQRSEEPKITRFSSTQFGQAPVKYYIKAVPAEFKAAFAGAFDGWNEKLTPVIGHKLLSYEFLDQGDPRFNQIIAGDVRFNVVEWDVNNRAPYGGFGPHISNQFTGEILSANVLIQGPAIRGAYSEWFKSSEKSRFLRAEGRDAEADAVAIQFKRQMDKNRERLEQGRVQLTLGKRLEFRVSSQLPALEDRLMQQDEFDEAPEGLNFEAYIGGYFQRMLMHELGHNLGLLHNFKGSLGASDKMVDKQITRSVMDYFDRRNTPLMYIGEYDVMAIAYGYKGVKPTHSDWFCGEEDVFEPDPSNPQGNAECSPEDATNDPFSFFESRLARSIDLLIARGKATAPTWELDDMERELGGAIKGLLGYAVTARATASKWTNFFGKGDRPSDPRAVGGYVVGRVKAQLCDPSFKDVLAKKQTEGARQKARENILALRAVFERAFSSFEVTSSADLQCP